MGAVTVQRALLLRNQEHCGTAGLPEEHLSCSGLYKGWHVTCMDFRGLQHFPPCTRDGNCSCPLSGWYGFTLLLYAYAPLLYKLWRKENCSHFREILIVLSSLCKFCANTGLRSSLRIFKACVVETRPEVCEVSCSVLILWRQFLSKSVYMWNRNFHVCGQEQMITKTKKKKK